MPPRRRVGQHLAGVDITVSVVGLLGLHTGKVTSAGQAQLLADLQSDQRLADEIVGLGDDEVDALLDRPTELFSVLLPHHVPGSFRVGRVVRPGVADVPCHQSSALGGDLVRDADSLPVQLLELTLPSDILELLAVCVVGERDHDI